MYIRFYNSIGNNTSGMFLKPFTWQKPSFIKSKNSQQQQRQHFTSPHNIQEIKIYNGWISLPCEIPTLSYTRSLKKVTLSGGAFPYWPL